MNRAARAAAAILRRRGAARRRAGTAVRSSVSAPPRPTASAPTRRASSTSRAPQGALGGRPRAQPPARITRERNGIASWPCTRWNGCASTASRPGSRPFTTRVDTPRRLVLELYPNGEEYVPGTPLRRRRGTPPIGLDLREAGNPSDGVTLDPAVGLPFNADAADGDVVAPLVYARPRASRGLRAAAPGRRRRPRGGRADPLRRRLPRRARAHRPGRRARAGVILYDDPADDGAGRGATIPDGPWRPAASVQRGALGDGIRIPVLPISADNARVCSAHCAGPAVLSAGAGLSTRRTRSARARRSSTSPSS